jgi:hypothetical protein
MAAKNTRQKKDILDINANVAVAFGLAVLSLLLLYVLFLR